MGFFDNFPYTNFHEINQNWLLKEMLKLKSYVENYTAVNNVSYAGVWDITKQYTQWAVVSNGDSTYMSKKPVPTGIAIDNEEFWIHLADLDPRISGIIQELSALTNNVGMIGEELQTLEKETARAVNVKDFGAVGDALYYNNATMTYYSDSGMTTAPTDDGPAVIAAIDYAVEHEIGAVYFPPGEYYMGSSKITLDISKVRLYGDGNCSLISSGLNAGDGFITIKSPLRLSMYDNARSPVSGIALKGSYYNGAMTADVAGIEFSGAADVVPCHCVFRDVVITHFGTGIRGGQIYKTTFSNCSMIACRNGYFLEAGSAIPLYIIGGYIECCEYGIVDMTSTWGNFVIVGCAIEYNRSPLYCTEGGRDIFIGCRFESDPYSSADYPFQLVACDFISCDFLFLGNYATNVGNWIYNPSQYEKNEYASLIYAGSGGINFTNCKIGVDSGLKQRAGYYKIATVQNGLHVINCEWTGDTANIAAPNFYAEVKNTF